MVLTLQSNDKLTSREKLHVKNLRHKKTDSLRLRLSKRPNTNCCSLKKIVEFLPGKYLKLLPEVRTGPGTSISASSWNFIFAKTFNKICKWKAGDNPVYFQNRCSVSQFPHSCICERFIYSQDRSAYIAGRSWEYVNRSHIYECRNWVWRLRSFISGNT